MELMSSNNESNKILSLWEEKSNKKYIWLYSKTC